MTTPAVQPPAVRRHTSVVHRGKLTDNLLDWLRLQLPAPVLLGDSEAPKSGGWTGQQTPGGQFVPYLTVKTLPAQPDPMGEALADRLGASWRLVYAVSYYGGTRSQAEFAADAARSLLGALHQTLINDGTRTFKIVKSAFVALGAVDRRDNTSPPSYSGTDTLEVWIDKH